MYDFGLHQARNCKANAIIFLITYIIEIITSNEYSELVENGHAISYLNFELFTAIFNQTSYNNHRNGADF